MPEWHPGGHRLHVHFAVGRFVRRRAIETAWGRGFVSIKLLGDLPVGSGSLEEARRAAGYLSKYVAKSFTDTGSAGGTAAPRWAHRFDVAQGFQPRRVLLRGRSADDVVAQASSSFGSNPIRLWRSHDQEDWQGPPAVWAQWGGRGR